MRHGRSDVTWSERRRDGNEHQWCVAGSSGTMLWLLECVFMFLLPGAGAGAGAAGAGAP